MYLLQMTDQSNIAYLQMSMLVLHTRELHYNTPFGLTSCIWNQIFQTRKAYVVFLDTLKCIQNTRFIHRNMLVENYTRYFHRDRARINKDKLYFYFKSYRASIILFIYINLLIIAHKIISKIKLRPILFY